MKRSRVALAIGLSVAMVVVIAALFPRIYLANDDIGFTEYLRKNTFTPWISPILARALSLGYGEAPGVPWYGLYQYALIIATGAILIHSALELVDPRAGLGRIATMLGATVIIVSHAILIVGITWTTVSISAIGTSVAAFITYAQRCQVARVPMSRGRSLVYGLLLVSGYMLRLQGLGAVVAALAPLLGWAALRFWRRRHLPRIGALIAFGAPFVLVFAIQNRIPQAPGQDDDLFNEFNNERGKIHGHTAYEGLDTRAPSVLRQAGWTVEEYRDFVNWLIIDESDYPLARVEKLLDTGGKPEPITFDWAIDQLHGIYADSAPSVLLFLTAAIAGLILAWLGVIDRRWGAAFSLGYLLFLIAVPIWMSAHFRFPQRVSLSFYSVAALGVFVYLARMVADHPAAEDQAVVSTDRRAPVALAIVACLLFGWARALLVWIDRDPWPYRAELQALEDRIATRGGFVFVYVQAGLVDVDPLRAEPRSYDGLQGGWGTFSTSWYGVIGRLGIHRGADLLPAMVDNPNAYLLTPLGTREYLEDWIRRKTHNPKVRLALVDAAAIPGGGRPELFRLVTGPLTRGSEEWKRLEQDEWAMARLLPGPPAAATEGLAFETVTWTAPYARYISELRHPAARIDIAPMAGGIRTTVTGSRLGDCAVGSEDGEYAGVHVPIHGLGAARFEMTLISPENIVGFNVYAFTKTSRSVRWRWILSPEAQRFGFSGALTLVPGHPGNRLSLTVNTAMRSDVTDLHFFVAVKPGTSAGFQIRNLEIAPP